MKFLLLCIVAVSAYTQVEYETSFSEFVATHSKMYDAGEVEARFNVFKKKMDDVLTHNAANHSWTIGINQFSDMTDEEFSKTMLGYIPSDRVRPTPVQGEFNGDIDWRSKGALTPVKDQKQCGSCWAFSATGGMEGAEAVKTNAAPTSVSEQSLVDCSGSYGNQGCNGGLMDNAFKYIAKNGIPTEASYAYTARDGTCKSFTSYEKCSTHTDTSNLETDIMKQPISVAVDAAKWSSYRSGTYKCSGRVSLDHGVLLAGSTADYWIIKNSWGSSWGNSGFMWLSKASGSNCGVDQAASYPTV